jgi:hypothetical protein
MADENKHSPGCISSLVDLVVVGAGAYRGFCNANGLLLETEELRLWLTWGPMLMSSGYHGLTSIPDGAKTAEKLGVGIGTGEALEAVSGTIIGGFTGGVGTLLSYCLGYGIGYVIAKTY